MFVGSTVASTLTESWLNALTFAPRVLPAASMST
jgi:hypothetical protein